MKYHDAYKRTASPIAWEVEKFSRHEPAKDHHTADAWLSDENTDDRPENDTEIPETC